MNYKYDIFLSHSVDNKDKVIEIAEALANEGFKVWLDEWNLSIGKNWHEAIEQAIKHSNLFIIYIAKEGISDWNINELNQAIKLEKTNIFPLLESGVDINTLPALLRNYQVFRIDNDNFLKELILSIKSSSRIDESNFKVKKLVNEGNYQEALKKSTEIISTIKRNNEISESTAAAYSNHASILRKIGNYQKAISFSEKALELINKSKIEKHRTSTISNLASAYADIGRYKESIDLFKKALLLDRKNLGEGHPNIAKRLSNLANAYSHLGNYEKAIELNKSALQIDLKNLKENHPNLAIRLSNLANVNSHLGNYEKATKLFESSLQIDLKSLGEDHPDVAIRLSNLANAYTHLGNYEKATKLFESCLQIDLSSFGENHPKVATDRFNLATMYIHKKNYEKALPLLKNALFVYEDTYGKSHEQTILIRNIIDEIDSATASEIVETVYNKQNKYEVIKKAAAYGPKFYVKKSGKIISGKFNTLTKAIEWAKKRDE